MFLQVEPGSLNGLQISIADIHAAHAELQGRGVPVSAVRHHDGAGFGDGKDGDYDSFRFFDDPVGKGWEGQESPRLRKAADSAVSA